MAEVIVEEAAEEPPGGEPAERPACAFSLCPICMALTAVGDARPDIIEHLLAASREALLALRSIIDARLDGPPGERPTRLERLTID
ncbi:MAG: hypothetical protein E6G47_05945 [Actinobacteria bacterium]|nr:MAG: hypothetical protein E6G47_05945 [Actinomycetota bacterium]